MKTRITKCFRRPSFLTGTIILFIILYLFHFQSTALMDNIDLEFSLLSTFCYSYLAILVFYLVFRLYEIYCLDQRDADFEILECLEQFLGKLKWVFGGLLSVQAAFHLYIGYHIIQDQPDAMLIHFLASELLNLFRAGSEWIRHHIEIIIRVNDLCILGYCANKYPIVPYVLAVFALWGLRKALQNRITRPILTMMYRLILKLLVIGFNVSLNLTKKLFIGIYYLLWYFKSRFFFRKRKTLAIKEKNNPPLTISLLDTAVGAVWQELQMIDPWIEMIHLRFTENN